ncbi:MAG TPA: LptE family protein [Prolixibacteraceae bacterium]|nr:LptE family protein [Prolixibacteraceae bacterium]
MKRMMKYLLAAGLLAAFIGCKINYSFTGASISPDVKTYSILDFPNRAKLVNPNLSNYFVEKLREKFTRQTSLNYLNEGGDLEFEGTISQYDVQPVSIKAGTDEASMNRLTIKISVKFTNRKNSEQDFESEFSAYADFDSSQLLSDVEDNLIEQIIKEIIDDIYNKSVANW